MKKCKRKYDEVNYWQSMADVMVALLLFILLILLLLIMYLVQMPDDDLGNTYEQQAQASEGKSNQESSKNGDKPKELDQEGEKDKDNEKKGSDIDEGGGQTGGSGQGGEEGNGNDKYEDPDPGAGNGEGDDKAAVYVKVVDEETGITIKKKGIEFELYGSGSTLQVLSTYYPKKIEYKKYQTDETGVFYLPEKLLLTSYSLHCLSTITGYDLADDVEFSLDEAHDWKDPYILKVPLHPSKNIIRVQLVDKDTGENVSGATFNVIASENITTQDGTTRYRKGDVVDTIKLNDKGYGESKEIFLGKYLLRQVAVPEFYAKNSADTAVEVKSKTESKEVGITQVTEEKTSVTVTLQDALYDTKYISGAKFELSAESGGEAQTYETDDKGRFTVTDLKKNTTYHIKQVATVSDYKMSSEDFSFTVNGDGLIDGKETETITVRNRIIRISVGVKDKLFRGQVSDVNVAIHDAQGNVVKVWDTTGLEQTIEGLTPGEYMVVIDGNTDKGEKITVEEKTDLQTFRFDKWTAIDIAVITALILLIIGIIVLFVHIAKRRRREKGKKGK